MKKGRCHETDDYKKEQMSPVLHCGLCFCKSVAQDVSAQRSATEFLIISRPEANRAAGNEV